MQNYRRVTLEDRIQIQSYLAVGLTASEIAKRLGFHKSSMSREIMRNQQGRSYQAQAAQERAKKEFLHCRRHYKIEGDSKAYIQGRLEQGWSPLSISQRQKREEKAYQISSVSIYRWVRRNPQFKILLRYGYKRRGFGRTFQRTHTRESSWKQSIRDRPAEAETRSQAGHWERDTFFGAKKRENVVVLCERKSRFVMLRKSKTLKARKISELTNEMLVASKIKTRSVTNDNGSEFFDVGSMKFPVYFCDVLKPQQRGTVENTIGLIRHFIKRGAALENISAQKIRALQQMLNLRPRRVLDYRTPYEVLYGQTVALAM